ncbi:hypothetical protein QBC35DRAFT_479984 [Podospora australis]|uniref:Uncharacterized protein n=1 Tax=Podospora australis TaxID=1536484 RepID=A0AAN7ANK3_9PEZI|nr:hypothetical protein QBC35DRAFT_479984 [Podospora australis]
MKYLPTYVVYRAWYFLPFVSSSLLFTYTYSIDHISLPTYPPSLYNLLCCDGTTVNCIDKIAEPDWHIGPGRKTGLWPFFLFFPHF